MKEFFVKVDYIIQKSIKIYETKSWETSLVIIKICINQGTDFPWLYFYFKKRFDMLDQFIVPSVTEKVIFYSLVLGQQPFMSL